jgi:ribosome maturation factor RimP
MSPILLKRMIDKVKIEELIKEKLDESMFLVDVSVSTGNVIHVEIDSFAGLSIDQCVAISRHIEGNLDREKDDFELQVSSPGAGQFFKVREQYLVNRGREIEVTCKGGEVIKGLLSEASANGIVVTTVTKEKPEGSNKKISVAREHAIEFDNIEKARVVISFK